MSGSPTQIGGLSGRWQAIRRSPTAWPSVAIVVAYVVVSLFGITNSSIGIEALSSTADSDNGVIFGSPRSIRSDEFLRSSPWRLGTTLDSPDSFRIPLTTDPSLATATPNDGVFEYVAFLDASIVEVLGPVLPDTVLFALYWWLPALLVALTLPMWLGRLGVRREISWMALALVVLSPAVAWWSMWPLLPLAWALAASVLILWSTTRACEQNRLDAWSILAAIASGLFLARTALGYFPWSLPLGAVILTPTILFALRKEQLLLRLSTIAIAAGSGVVLLGGVVIENWAAISILANTVYPGARMSSGSAVDPGIVFGAQHLGLLRINPPISTQNQSELSTVYTVLVFPTSVLLLVLPRRAWCDARTWATAGSLIAILVVLFAWVSTEIPTSIGTAIPGLNRVPPDRLAQILGIPVILLFAFALDRYARFKDDSTFQPTIVAACGVSTLLVSAWAGTLLRASELPSLTVRSVWVVSLLLAIAVTVAVWNPKHPAALLPLVVGAFALVVVANPTMTGLGGLRTGPAVDLIRSNADPSAEFTRWSSDTLLADAILMANAIPAISGQQWTGPAEEAWLILDPDRRFEDIWNRATSYVSVQPKPGLTRPQIDSPQSDMIVVAIDPCDPALDELEVGHMITSAPIDSPCLVSIGGFALGGLERFAYRRGAPG